MMRKIVALVCLIAFLAVSNAAYAYNPATKLGRGLLNATTFAFEAIDEVKQTTEDRGPIVGCTIGVFKGIMKSILRCLVGAYETITCLIPYPNGYGPVLTDPDSILDWEW